MGVCTHRLAVPATFQHGRLETAQRGAIHPSLNELPFCSGGDPRCGPQSSIPGPELLLTPVEGREWRFQDRQPSNCGPVPHEEKHRRVDYPSQKLRPEHTHFSGFSIQAAESHLSEKSLALIGNASGQGAGGARNCSEAFSIRRLEGRRRQWWALLWS
jgi:hypothetical protein